jgi:hypothetical protein
VPIIDLLLHHVLGMTIALLDLAFELLALAVNRGKVVLSELAPLFLDLSDELLPVAFDTIPINETLLIKVYTLGETGNMHTPSLRYVDLDQWTGAHDASMPRGAA